MIILAIETSCDETALALYDESKGLLEHVLQNQNNQLTKHGGVIPEIAARTHIQYLTPLLLQLLNNNNLKLTDLSFIAYTKGPGLIGSLLTGAAFAKSLSFGLKIPAIGINHLEGHLLACMITETPTFPFLALLVSGGHTMLIKANSLGNYEVLGETLDDAAGEALDKTAKMLGLTPPTGKELAKLAALSNKPADCHFTKPLIEQNNLNFSFSGLKTAAMLKIKQGKYQATHLAFAFQQAVMDTLIIKTKLALKITGLNQLVVAGGVSANYYLREQLLQLNNHSVKVFFPKLEFCTDNAAMIAIAAFLRIQKYHNCLEQILDQDLDIIAKPRWELNYPRDK